MRFILIIPGIAAVIFGLVMFVRIGDDERRLAAKVQTVKAGQIQPEVLIVIEKYVNSSRHGSGWSHVVFRSSRQARVNCNTTREFYDSVSLSNTVTGYYFPDGYYIYGSIGQGAGTAKWIFLGFGLMTGTGLLAVALTSRKSMMPNGMTGDMGSLLTAIRNRGKRE